MMPAAGTVINIADVTGTSTFTYAGSALYMPGSSPLAVSLDNFQGNAALVNLNTNGDIDITGNGGAARKCWDWAWSARPALLRQQLKPRGCHQVPERPDDRQPAAGHRQHRAPRAGHGRRLVFDRDLEPAAHRAADPADRFKAA